ncbi:MAG: response regulator transcription factor [Planctomycetes bacterium]|nr:response regulator transcription factor [Planctomycetota bacterium]
MRILIIEDEGKIAAFLKRGLKEEGYAVDVAADGEQGHFLASTQEYDLIILDLMLPGMDGISLCRKLRSGGNEVKILILSARDKVKEKVLGLDAGADDYLTKPFAFEELLARVRALLRKREAGSPTKLQVADLSMDLLTHKVMRAGREIELTAKEFSLLEYLMLNAGTVVTRTMIAEHVWDVNFDTFTNVIDVYMSYIRDKIDRKFPKKLIRTVRGRGYVIKG